MSSTLIKNAFVVNEGLTECKDVFIKDGIISNIGVDLNEKADEVIEAKGLHLMPGVIDDQVHFREPGLTHKADIQSEARAAVAGGITSFMEMPNTKPQALTQELLEEKYKKAEKVSVANYSFFMGASNDNLEEVLKTNPRNVGAIKIFMGSSTGNMLVDNQDVLEQIFSKSKMLIAVHCEDEDIIRENTENYRKIYGEDVPIQLHPLIRSDKACYKSSSMAIDLAKKHNTRLHVFHLSTAIEMDLLDNKLPLEDKMITAEVCIHHLWFDDSFYNDKGTLIKWNPAVKTKKDREAVFNALLENKIDVIATDHAPHTLQEKQNTYFKAPSGGPLVQHALVAMLEFYHQGKISLEKIVEKMSHSPAICFKIEKRGFIKIGYWADLVLVDLNDCWTVTKDNILYKCGWSPFEDQEFKSKVKYTFVNGHLAYNNGKINDSKKGKRLLFDR
ncbi:MAG: dihydroorotase [Flavobacteriales bacterium]